MTILPGFWDRTLGFFEDNVDTVEIYHDLAQHPVFRYDRCVQSAISLFTNTYLRESIATGMWQTSRQYISSSVLCSPLKHGNNPPLERLVEGNY